MIKFKFSQQKLIGVGLLLTLTMASQLVGCDGRQHIEYPEEAVATNSNETSTVDSVWPKLSFEVKKDPVIEARIATIVASMTLEQKVAQMIQPEIRDISVADMRTYGFGSYLNGGGAFPNNDKHATPADWIDLAEKMYQASIDDSIDGSAIPTIWGTDAVHGHNNVIGATLFPHNIGLGAANNPELIEKIAQVTATEVMVTGIDWVFAPTVAVVRNDRWGRTYEGYSEDPEIVAEYAAAIVKGLQGQADKDFLADNRVISTVKHFLGDGGTDNGKDQGDTLVTEQELFDIHAQGYVGGLQAGSQSVMASFNSWHGVKNHGNKYLLTEVLKDRMGFDGFVVGDWNGHGQVSGCSNESCPQAINAGLDIFMVPTGAWKPLYENTVAQVQQGKISMARVDDAVSRILRVKLRAGIFDKPSPAQRVFSGKTELIGAKEHRNIARQAVRQSLVLLKNKQALLPLSPHQKILVTGDGADNIGKQSGGWTITWQGTGNNNNDFPGASSIYDGIVDRVNQQSGNVELSTDGSFTDKPDVAIVVFGEEPYAEGVGDIESIVYQKGVKSDLALLHSLKAQGIPVVSVFISGRPLWINAELNASDAFVAAWLPGSEGAGVADVLFTDFEGKVNYDFTGKLSYSWPETPEQLVLNRFDDDYQPLFPYGFGLSYADQDTLADDLSEVSQQIAQLKPLTLLQGVVKKPWQLSIQAADVEQVMNSSLVANKQVKVRTIDRNVQEDARQLVFSGQGLATVKISSQSGQDLSQYRDNNAALVFDIKMDSTLTSTLSLAMDLAKIDLNKALLKLKLDQWQQISVDLACFSQLGANMTEIVTPFSLIANDELTLSISDISLVPHMAEQSTFRCQ